jgi:hypothetical protein
MYHEHITKVPASWVESNGYSNYLGTVSELNGTDEVNGQSNGHSNGYTNGYTNGHTTNGHTTNGHAANGHSSNGHITNGHTSNGHTNGHSTNGHTTNGVANGLDNENGHVCTNGHEKMTTNGHINGNMHDDMEEMPSTFLEHKAVRTVYGPVPLKYALDWPVFASYDELVGCAAYMGGRIPTFEEAKSIYAHVDAIKRKEAEKTLGKTVPAVNG